ncbi:hypothetical protein SLEP1_g25760 [Rubroshorea leprosula]|uniref:Uncharacterized protein n=1 Tax=Rubroshorea leprosula TaxID=152421 RepID=A0AAV5JUH1_9ROSI|nr:hypothetical protein SLEP1_g25760 [Rubroshorea leprosula]
MEELTEQNGAAIRPSGLRLALDIAGTRASNKPISFSEGSSMIVIASFDHDQPGKRQKPIHQPSKTGSASMASS